MSAKKGFLPEHPKIVKKVPKNYNVSLNSSFSNEPSIQQERMIEEILQNQKSKIKDLQDRILITKLKNENTKTALQFYQPENEIDQIQIQINKVKEEENDLIQKIKNCETVQKTTTVQQYYLWQKKQIIEDHQFRVSQLVGQKQQEKQKLVDYVEETKNAIEEVKEYIKSIARALNDLQKGKDLSDDEDVQLQSVNPQKVQKMKEEYVQLISTTEILRQNHNILTNQVIDNIQARQLSLQSAFDSYQASLIKDLLKIKDQISKAEPVPPNSQQLQYKSEPLLKQYGQKMLEFKEQLDVELKEISDHVLNPMNFEPILNYLRVEENNTLKVHEEEYSKIQEEYIKNEDEIRSHENGLKETINDTVVYQQKSYQIDSALHKILQLGLSLT